MKNRELPLEFRSITGLGEVVQVYRKHRVDTFFHLACFAGYWVACAIIFPNVKLGQHWTGVDFFIIACLIGAGGYWGWRISTWWRKAVGLYTEGLVFAEGHRIRIYKWEELAWIKTYDLTTYVNFVPSRFRRCEIAPFSGEPFTVNSGIATGSEFYDQVVRHTFTHFWGLAADAYNNGGWVDFGAIRVCKSLGLEVGGKRFEWSDLGPITIRNGVVQIIPQRGKFLGTRSVSTHEIQNASVCLQFIRELLCPKPPIIGV